MDPIKDDAAFLATLTDEGQKTYYTNAVKTASDAAVTKFKTDADAARKAAVPEKYEFKFGDKTPLDANEDAAKIAEWAKGRSFTKEDAQALATFLDERATALTARQTAAAERES